MTPFDQILPVVIVAGPTASGKSALALDLAKKFNGVVINADSIQVYSELSVLSARPDETETQQAPHRLYGVLSGREACSAGKWRELAMREIGICHANGQLPILTGGTGMYINALVNGIAPIPDIAPSYREQITRQLADQGHESFFADFQRKDPQTAETLDATNTQRLIRAAEVLAATGRGLASWHQEKMVLPPEKMKFLKFCYMPDREFLYERCNLRFDLMIKQGAIEEVKGLLSLELPPSAPVMKAVGVREISSFLAGEIDIETAKEHAKRETRRYAKRQITWFKHQMLQKEIIDAQYSESLRDKLSNVVYQFLLTTP